MTAGPSRQSAELLFQLLSHDDSSGVSTLSTGASNAFGPLLLGMDGARHRHLLVPSGSEPAVEDRLSAGVQIYTRELVDGTGVRRTYVDVHCLAPHLAQIFATLTDDLIVELTRTTASVGATCVSVLDRWRQLLAPAAGAAMSRQEQAGLLAELLVLERLAEVGGVSTIQAWTGWEPARIDFRGPGVALEVKASFVHDHRTFVVDGIRQLEPPADENLVVVLYRLEPTPQGKQSLPGVIGRLLGLGFPRSELTRRLVPRGWGNEQEYERFDLVESVAWEIGDGFPRVVPSLLVGGVPIGVSEMTYRVTADAIPPMSESDFEACIRALVEG